MYIRAGSKIGFTLVMAVAMVGIWDLGSSLDRSAAAEDRSVGPRASTTPQASRSGPGPKETLAKPTARRREERLLARASASPPATGFRLSTGETVRPTVTKVPHADIRKISRKIDELVDAKLKARDIAPADPARDAVFLRRIYLDIVGRIPTMEESQAFLDSPARTRRADLIDDLLDSYGHVSHQFNYWADVLRIKSRLRNVTGQPYVDFVKDSLSANKPYDQFVRELITASGPSLQRGNGAVGYYLRDANMQEDNMSNTVRVFLGTRLECAQCHDHPFDIWTQRDYYEMLAFTGGIEFRGNDALAANRKELSELRKDPSLSQEERQSLRRVLEPLTTCISGSGTGLARLPENYESGEGEPFDIVTAKTMFEKRPLVDAEVPQPPKRVRKTKKPANAKYPQRIPNAPELRSREAYAQWMTSRDNPRFATVIANRLWKQAMGLGVVEPVDTFMDETTGSNPKLLAYLTQSIIDLEFDMNQFLRAIYNSDTYQRVADVQDVSEPDAHCFNGPLARRMTAEQIWDSYLVLSVADVDQRSFGQNDGLRYFPGVDIYEGYEKLQQLDVDEFRTLADALRARKKGDRAAMTSAMSEVFGDSVGMQSKTVRRAKSGKDAMLNGLSDNQAAMIRKQVLDLDRRFKHAQQTRNRDALKEVSQERRKLFARVRHMRSAGKLLRASELPSPAKPGHFLREFGQSDREQIENGNKEPSVTQTLTMMNGLMDQLMILNSYSNLMQQIEKAPTPQGKVRTAYGTMLTRHPRPEELRLWSASLQDDPEDGLDDLVWTLANSVEFLFVK